MATAATAFHAGCGPGASPGGAGDPAPEPRADAGMFGKADAGTPVPSRAPIVIVMIGDGMGREHVEAARRERPLRMDGLPRLGEVVTSSLSGITDSAASATAMATGEKTFNAWVGIDRRGEPAQTLVELAHDRGLPAGVVTTASLPHATPAAFTAHQPSRHDYPAIAADQATRVRPEVMLGGGRRYFDAHLDDLAATGYQVASDRVGLALADADAGDRLVGVFADDHLDYVVDREVDSAQPTLTEMTLRAIEFLDRDQRGFFLMVEGARIDMASHGNDFERALGETLAFDDAVGAVMDWAAGRSNVTLIVTSDHECGGLRLAGGPSWRWGDHTNARIDIRASGPGTEVLDGAIVDHRWVHAVASARLAGAQFVEPAPELTPDGRLADLRHVAAVQVVESGFGPGFNQLDALYVDADADVLALGIEGVFEWDANAVVLLIDVDFPFGAGERDLRALTDDRGVIDQLLRSVPARVGVEAFGADYAVVALGGSDPQLGQLWDDTGLRRLSPRDDLPWLGVATNYGEGVRAAGDPVVATPGEGLEVAIPWRTLYPELDGAVPTGAAVGVVALLVNTDGGYASNQALPPLAPGAANPGRAAYNLPAVVQFVVDSDADGRADGDAEPAIVTE